MVELVNPPQLSSECQNRGSLTPAISAGDIVGVGLRLSLVDLLQTPKRRSGRVVR
jgi:hypothetical protein